VFGDVHLGEPGGGREGDSQAGAPGGHEAGAGHVRHLHAGKVLAADRRESAPLIHAPGKHVVLTFFSTRAPPAHEPRCATLRLRHGSPDSTSSPADALHCLSLSESRPH
jgi:hypothetical protein